MRNRRLALGGSITGQPRRRLRRPSRLVLILMAIAVTVLIAAILLSKHPILIWNASASAPRGLYRLTAITAFQHGDWVLVWVPEAVRQMSVERGYLPANVPLIKPVMALPGERICAVGDTIQLPTGQRLTRLSQDGQGRLLPAWQDCRMLAADEVFLANPDVAASFDSRYFGPVSRHDVIGRLVPLWVW